MATTLAVYRDRLAALNAEHPDWTPEQFVAATGISHTTVCRHLAIIRGEGAPTPLPPSPSADTSEADEAAYVEALNAVSDPNKLAEIAARFLADPNTAGSVKVRVMEFLSARQRESGATTMLPGPTSIDEQDRRIIAMLQAVGLKRTRACVRRAFPLQKAENS